ncbi:hypothetical protein AVEN_93337-1 [Araneus ventricosus]|uniref:Uncharacterized protein n=1 Tax=Araneus ventricosus TaxID=182803 RepID=A0A4Y2NI81_ARAVE|nr:hypothetical protein AVEN_93337-1 [Araneus ventricosus]
MEKVKRKKSSSILTLMPKTDPASAEQRSLFFESSAHFGAIMITTRPCRSEVTPLEHHLFQFIMNGHMVSGLNSYSGNQESGSNDLDCFQNNESFIAGTKDPE